jgi:transposase
MQKGPKPAELMVSEEEQTGLEELVRRHSTPQQLAKRGRMVLEAAEGKRNAEIARELKVSVDTVRSWRGRWISLQAIPLSELSVSERLTDAPRPGKPSQITAEQRCQMVALACEQPKERPISRLSRARNCRGNDAARDRQVDFATTRIASVKKRDLQPHLIRDFLTPPKDPQRAETIRAICTVYQNASSLAKQGERTVSGTAPLGGG